MRVQNKPKTADPQPGRELQAWAEAVQKLSPTRGLADFDHAKLAIVVGLRRLASQLQMTR